ncbi:nucleotidyltransferase family protein [Robertkochia sediminum]|uniref:nucleotidyltransferase family protein n=1 Tax=Robertkochia sediminum TaxID=2785326 RepID=UPI00193358F8|nr:nucleotidyltransferase family protein [Robertkochia sediminum]MBL7473025.1 nucleotidyltransferase family protein [Robertkochia sediminum]
MTNYALLTLAAGASNRMGRAKQLLPWGDNTLLGHALEQVRQVRVRRKYLLLGSRAEQILEEVDITGFIPMVFAGWEEGMGAGIAYAINNMINDLPELQGVMVTLADQPMVDTVQLEDMLSIHRESQRSLLACDYGTKTGVPAIISGEHLSALQQLQGDRGASELFRNFPGQLERYVPERSLIDIDDPETYRQCYWDTFGTQPPL